MPTSPTIIQKRAIRAGAVETYREGLGSVYTWELPKPYYPGGPCFFAAAYTERSYRASWTLGAATAEARDRQVERFFKVLGERQQNRAAHRQARTAFQHDWKVGEVLVNTWGYEQTNVDFYQVVELVGRQSVRVRQIESRPAADQRGAPFMTGYVEPVRDAFKGEPLLKRVVAGAGGCTERGTISLDHGATHIWDGRPQHYTSYN